MHKDWWDPHSADYIPAKRFPTLSLSLTLSRENWPQMLLFPWQETQTLLPSFCQELFASGERAFHANPAQVPMSQKNPSLPSPDLPDQGEKLEQQDRWFKKWGDLHVVLIIRWCSLWDAEYQPIDGTSQNSRLGWSSLNQPRKSWKLF